MPRYFIRISYKGTRFAGWQRQINAVTVQEVLDRALTTILGTEIRTTGCGRTDTGVHAVGFYAHFDLVQAIHDAADLTYRVNAVLPEDIVARELFPVHENAHARYDATSRQYKYFVTQDRDPFLNEFVCFHPQQLDPVAMNKAASTLVGTFDYTSFSKTRSGMKSPVCTIMNASWTTQGRLWVFTVTADRFLRGMVRAMVGTMFEVGKGKTEPGEVAQILRARDRAKAGAAAPACGLFLTRVTYPYVSTAESDSVPFA